MKISYTEYKIGDDKIKDFDLRWAIEVDTKHIIREAENSYPTTFHNEYDPESLHPVSVRLFVDENNDPIYGMVIYSIYNKKECYERFACGNYYPFRNNDLEPHPYQGSICW